MNDLFTLAPPGQIYVCGACGKRSRNRCGETETGKRVSLDYGWDESCMLRAVLCYERNGPDDTWVAVNDDRSV